MPTRRSTPAGPDKARNIVATALLVGVLAPLATISAAQTRAPAPADGSTSAFARDFTVCLNAADTMQCILSAVERVAPLTAYEIAVDTGHALPDAPTIETAEVSAIHAVAVARQLDRQGGDPAAVLKDIDSLQGDASRRALQGLCFVRLTPAMAEDGPRYAAWIPTLYPSVNLTRTAADQLEAALKQPQSGRTSRQFLAEATAECRAASGDLAGVERALEATDPRLRIIVLMAMGRLDEAASTAASARFTDIGQPSATYGSVFQFVFLQRTRQLLLTRAQQVGRSDTANRVAEIMLDAALASDRPVNRIMQSGVPPALAQIVSSGDEASTIRWVKRLDAAVRPGQRGWNYADAIAVHRAWVRLGRTDRAHGLYDAVAVEAAKPAWPEHPTPEEAARNRRLIAEARADEVMKQAIIAGASPDSDSGPSGAKRVAAEMAAGVGRWDAYLADRNARAADVFIDDLRSGMAVDTLEDRLAHAVSPADRAWMLDLCAAGPEATTETPGDAPQWRPLALDMAAGCVRRLAAEHKLARRAFEGDLNGRSGLEVPNPALVVAARAARADRTELAREMLRLYLAAFEGQGAESISAPDIFLMMNVALVDQNARCKL